jgi:hypothetical protein
MERPLSGGFSLSMEGGNALQGPGAQTDSGRMRDRALWCRQLADGTGDLQFAIKLNALSEEYEGVAVLLEARAIPPK